MEPWKTLIYIISAGISVHLAEGNLLSLQSGEEQLKIANTIVKLIKNCHSATPNTLMLAGDFSVEEIRLISNVKPVIFFQAAENVKIFHRQKFSEDRKLHLFIIKSKSRSHLNETLRRVKNSRWWNPFGVFVVFDETSKSTACEIAERVLQNTWNMELLNSFYFCVVSGNWTAYTFNPYANWAPNFWDAVNYSQNYFWIFYQTFSSDSALCEIFNFDKTIHFYEHHNIKMVIQLFYNKSCRYNEFVKMSSVTYYDLIINNILLNKMNSSLHDSYVCSNETAFIDDDGFGHGSLADIEKGVYDLIINSDFLVFSRKIKFSPFLGETGLTLLSHKQHSLSVLKQMIMFFKPWLFATIAGLIIISAMVLKVSIKRSCGSSLMEMTSLFLNGPILKEPRIQSFRVYFFTILVYVLIVQSLFRGQILTFIMRPKSGNLDYFSDLNSFPHFKIYCPIDTWDLIGDEYREKCIRVDNTCDIIATDTESVCIWDKDFNLDLVAKYNLYSSKEVISRRFWAYRMRHDWPLSRRVDQLVSQLFESGISDFIVDNAGHEVRYEMEKEFEQKMGGKIKQLFKNKARPLRIKHLDFSFRMWLIGIALSVSVFILEIQIAKIKFKKNIKFKLNYKIMKK